MKRILAMILVGVLLSCPQATPESEASNATNSTTANADQIATFLSGANSKNWPADEMKRMMREHLDLTTTEVTARLNKDWKADIEAYEKVHTQILHMGDALTNGIVKQFPEKFK